MINELTVAVVGATFENRRRKWQPTGNRRPKS